MKTDISRTSSLWLNPKGVSGLQSRRLHSGRLGKFRAANRGHSLNATERAAVEDELRSKGILPRATANGRI
jgi:hypothetical protein